MEDNSLYEGDYNIEEEEEDSNPSEFDISVSPNDFNIKTIFDFIKSGVVKIPGFQRNYVWDIKRASKLIESLLIGIPIPQIFLYEEAKNSFLVIDGQQRLLTIYYFLNKRFPKQSARIRLRMIFSQNKGIPEDILADNTLFDDFNLQLPENLPNTPNKFDKKNYETLNDEDRDSLNLKTIRNIIIKQNSPDDDSVVYEIFSRLNTGGINLKPQEIRSGLFHSKFFDMLYEINLNENWRKLLPNKEPDNNMKDIEILLRGFALLVSYENYSPSLTKFLNLFSKKARKFTDKEIEYFKNLFEKFISYVSSIDEKIFYSESDRFNITIYESIFVALCEATYQRKATNIKSTTIEKLSRLKQDRSFIESTQKSTTSKKYVLQRIKKAKEIL